MNSSARAGRIRPRVRVSVIIPVAPKASAWAGVGALARARNGLDIEIIEIRGQQPARQRNLAAQRARGDYLYFIDHDSQVDPDAIQNLLQAFAAENVGAAGGPNPGAGLETPFTMATELVLGSGLGSLIVRRRYAPYGDDMRAVGEESLILCNLMVRRELFLELGGFDPRLYPNEENEFLNRMRAAGKLAIYVPKAQVMKPRAPRAAEFLGENFRYARGRMEQVWINPSLHDAPYVSGLAAIVFFVWASASVSQLFAGIGLAAYLAAAIFEGFRLALSAPRRAVKIGYLRLGWLTASLMFLRHATYAAGLLFGALTGWRKRSLRLKTEYFSLKRVRLYGHGAPAVVRSLEPVGPPVACSSGGGIKL